MEQLYLRKYDKTMSNLKRQYTNVWKATLLRKKNWFVGYIPVQFTFKFRGSTVQESNIITAAQDQKVWKEGDVVIGVIKMGREEITIKSLDDTKKKKQ